MQRKLIKNLLLVLTLVVLCFAVGMTASALEPTGQCGDDVCWTFDETTGELVISGEGDMWSYDNYMLSPFATSDITSVNIQNGVTSIGDCTFYACSKLTNVTMSDSITFIGYQCFTNCASLEKINLSENLAYIIDQSFAYCTSLKEIYIPASVELIDIESFIYCVSLEKVILSEGLEIIGDCGFAYCTSLREIYIPESVTDLHDTAFCDCFSLEKVVCKNNSLSFYDDYSDNIFCADFEITTTKKEFVDKIKTMVLERNKYFEVYLKYCMGNSTEVEVKKYMEESLQAENNANACTAPYDEKRIITGIILYGGIHSTAEIYALERNIPFAVLEGSEHPDKYFAKDWTYDYNNMVRYRQCEFTNCDVRIEEALETTTDSDVEIIAPTDPDTDFVVDVITDYVVIEETISNNVAGDFEIVKAFDITMKNKDGVHVQPDGTVKVKLPFDWSKDGVYKVYRVNDDGTLTDMNAYREGSHMVFETDHFSVYVIVDESEKADEPTTPDEPQEETKKDFFSKIIDWFRSLIDLIISWFKK